MKIGCCSDTHAQIPPEFEGIDAYLHAGDIYNRGRQYKEVHGPTPNMVAVGQWASRQQIPIVWALGNHDCNDNAWLGSVCTSMVGCHPLGQNLKVVVLGWHGGVYSDLPREMDMRKVCTEAMNDVVRKSSSKDKFIVLTHFAANFPELFHFNGNPEGWAFNCIRELVIELKPLALIEGHIHELSGVDARLAGPDFETLVAFPGPNGGVLDVDVENKKVSFDWVGKRKPKNLGY
jgi:Icc-related predicted phosphoesterase